MSQTIRGKLAETALRPALRRLARARLIRFTQYTFPGYDACWHHRLLADTLDRWIAGEIRRLIVTMPPRHGKSELVSRRLPAFILGRNPDARIICASHTASLAEANSRDVRRIVASPRFRQLFGALLAAPKQERYKQTDAHWEIPRRKGHLRAAGVDGTITGFGLDYGIIDDPVRSAEEAQSATLRQRLWDWFHQDFWTRRARDARVLVTMTRWNTDDLVGRIERAVADGRMEPWQIIHLEALRERVDHPADPRQPGEPLWPALIGAEELAEIRRNDPKGFAALYQGDPVEASGTEWPDAFFGPWLWCPRRAWPDRGDLDPLVMACDPSRGASDKPGDYAAIVWAGLHPSGTVYADADLGIRDPSETLTRLLELYDRLRPDFLAVEVNQFQLLFARELDRLGKEHYGMRLPLWYINNTVPKILRIRRLGPYLANRELALPDDSPGARLVVEQLRDFPIGAHDDGPDALEMAIRVLCQHTPERAQSLAYRPQPRDSIPH